MPKEQPKLIKESKTHRTFDVPAYSDNVLTGWGQVTLFQENKEGLEAAKRALTLDNLKDLNRQKTTDVKNDVRRGRSLWTALKKAAQSNPDLAKEVELLAKKYGFNIK